MFRKTQCSVVCGEIFRQLTDGGTNPFDSPEAKGTSLMRDTITIH